MWAARYFSPRYWSDRYWANVGSGVVITFSDAQDTDIGESARRRVGSMQTTREIGDSTSRRIR
jgi:hypothetical protein